MATRSIVPRGNNEGQLGTASKKWNAVNATTINATTFNGNVNGKAMTAGTADNANKLINKNWYWSGQGGQPTWLWGGTDGANMYVYNPANFRVANADTADDLHAHGGRNNEANKLVRTNGNGYIDVGYINSNNGVENGNVTNVIYDNGDGYFRKCSLAHLASKISAVTGGGSHGSQLFTASGTFKVPAGVTSVYVTAAGGGGGGNYWRDGGWGATVYRRHLSVVAGGTYAITVGAAGAGGASINAKAGGTTSFGNLLSVSGGGAPYQNTTAASNGSPREFYSMFSPYGTNGRSGGGSNNGSSGGAGIIHVEW